MYGTDGREYKQKQRTYSLVMFYFETSSRFRMGAHFDIRMHLIHLKWSMYFRPSYLCGNFLQWNFYRFKKVTIKVKVLVMWREHQAIHTMFLWIIVLWQNIFSKTMRKGKYFKLLNAYHLWRVCLYSFRFQ